jgi:nitrogen regulatory protein P-II 1
MKKVEAIIRPERVRFVIKALEEKGFVGLTVTEVKGRGRQKGVTLQWKAGEYRVDVLPKVQITMVVEASKVEDVVRIITKEAKTGKVGDGKIFVCPVEEVIRVRTGERGKGAI